MKERKSLIQLILLSLIAILCLGFSQVSAQDSNVQIRDHRKKERVPAKRGQPTKALKFKLPTKKLIIIEPPETTPIEKAGDQLLVEDWMGSTHNEAPQKLTTGKSTILILADDIEFTDRKYSFLEETTPKNVILIANEIRFRAPVEFNLQDRRGGPTRDKKSKASGGNLTIITRRLVFDEKSSLTIISTGEGASYGGAGGCGGNITIAAEHFEAPRRLESFLNNMEVFWRKHFIDRDIDENQLKEYLDIQSKEIDDLEAWREFESLIDKKVKFDEELLEVLKRIVKWKLSVALESDPYGLCVFKLNKGGIGSPMGRDGEIHEFNKIKDIINLDPQLYGPAVSTWVIALLEQLAVDINNAVGREDRAKIIQLFLKYKELLDKEKYPIIPDDRDSYLNLTDWLNASRNANLYSLWAYSITVNQPGSVPRPLDVFIEGNDPQLKTRLAPTEALVRRRQVGGRNVLGLLQFVPERPDEIVMTFEVELTVDPWLSNLVAKELANTDEAFGGVFTNWDLHARDIADMGIKESKVNPTPSGNVLQVSLTIDTNKASFVMFKLASSSGIRLMFDWKYRSDLNFKGEWSGPALSLLRRVAPDIAITDDGRVTNTSSTAITIEFVQIGVDQFHACGYTIPPGETRALPLPEGTDPTKVVIPAEAVVYTGMDPFTFEDDFFIVNGEYFTEKITVTNLLGHDEDRGGGLEHVEINLVYIIGKDEDKFEVPSGPYKLTSKGTQGSEIMVTFLKPWQGSRQVRVSGTAVYENGYQTLKPKIFSDLTVKITKDMLPPIKR